MSKVFLLIKNILVVTLVLFFVSSCSLWKANEWNAYKVVLEVHGESGEPISGANILSQARHDQVTNYQGRSNFFFTQTGLHVVTIQSPNTQTKQIKIKIPDDANNVVIVSLQPK